MVVLKRVASDSNSPSEFQINGRVNYTYIYWVCNSNIVSFQQPKPKQDVSQDDYEALLSKMRLNQLFPFVYDQSKLVDIFHGKCTEMFERYCGSFSMKEKTNRLKAQYRSSQDHLDRINQMRFAVERKHCNMHHQYKRYMELKFLKVNLSVYFWIYSVLKFQPTTQSSLRTKWALKCVWSICI